jgi:probable phosphoglycerate mutase
MKTLIIVRHGNTFLPDEEPRRVGARTDLKLVEEKRSILAARNLKTLGLIPTRVVSAPLLRTMQTAKIIVDELGLDRQIQPNPDFTEIDYGEDENKTENDVIKRLGIFYLGKDANPEKIMSRGKEEIDRWNTFSIPPQGWNVDGEKIIKRWRIFASQIKDEEIVLVVSSNGIIRFVPHILSETGYATFRQLNKLKVATGGICIFNGNNKEWQAAYWNLKSKLDESIY